MTKREQIEFLLYQMMKKCEDRSLVHMMTDILQNVLIVPKDKLDCIQYFDGLEIVPETGTELHKTLGQACFYIEVTVAESDYDEKAKAEIEKDIRYRMEKYLESNKEEKK